MLSTVALWLVVSASGDVPAADAAPPAPLQRTPVDAAAATPSSEAFNFDTFEDPVAPKVADDARIKQFLGALAGGAVGFGAVMAFVPLTQLPAAPFCTTCITPGSGILSALAPVAGVLGAWGGHALMGGRAGPLAPFAALAPALLAALAMTVLASEMELTTVIAHVPLLVGAGAILAGGAAFALDARARSLGALGAASSLGSASAVRSAMTVLVASLTTAGAGLLSVLAGVLNPILGVTAGFLQSVGVAAATWGTHKALNGRGTFLAALAGVGLAGVVAASALGMVVLAQSSFRFGSVLSSTAAIVIGMEAAIAAGMFIPTLALDLSHTQSVQDALPRIQFTAAPVNQGAMVGAMARF